MASKRNIQFQQPAVPKFLRKFKERVGYKEPANVNDKFQDNIEQNKDGIETGNVPKMEPDSDRAESADEKPVVVVLKKGDLTAEEVEEHKHEHGEKGECWDLKNDKPVFKQPAKRTLLKEAKDTGGARKKSKKCDVKGVKNHKLLSFDEDDENG